MHLPGQKVLSVTDSSPGASAPVVFLHEYGLDRTMWHNVLPAISADIRAVTLDLRGHGDSHSPPGPWSMRDLVYDVADTLFALNIRDAVVVGSGIGGMVAQALAAEVPKTVRAMVLIGTAAKLETEARWLDRAQRLAGMDATARASALLTQATYGPPPAQLFDIAARTAPQTLYRFCEAIAHTDLRQSTDALRLPTLGLVGRADRITPPDLMRELIEGIPGAQFEILPKCGHLAPVEAPLAVAAAFDAFLIQTGHLIDI